MTFTFVDWDTLCGLSRHVAFKGFNDMYLQHVVGMMNRNNFNQFSSEDPNNERPGYEIILLHPDGHIRVRSDFVGQFGDEFRIGYGQIQQITVAQTLTLCFGRLKLVTTPLLFTMQVIIDSPVFLQPKETPIVSMLQ
ncbi:uncharacterized protein LOC126657697 isoform X2 [Mercurialis annua]|uniref:uncharacterized protein LOC126657697 isoform X2 n=1 Tax=Mercurialis annua TaxID=3986 RepID=UPI002160C71D|nr:uncharacterized protein LOC126657697 isoform X2 [Mercurialis annua]